MLSETFSRGRQFNVLGHTLEFGAARGFLLHISLRIIFLIVGEVDIVYGIDLFSVD